MPTTSIDVAKVVFFQPQAEHLASAARRAESHAFEVDTAHSVTEIVEMLGSPARGVLVLGSFAADVRAAAKAVRAQKGWKRLPIFAIVPDHEILISVLKQANDLQVEILPTSLPESRRWQKLREAHETVRAGKRLNVCNRRAHFRLPVTAKAVLMAEAQTVDISEGGVAFLTNQVYAVGAQGLIDVRSLLGDLEEGERSFRFEVVSIKPQRGAFRYLIGARFVEMTEPARDRLKAALELIEPTDLE